MSNDYRSRIYDSYVSARAVSLAPNSIEGLRPRRAYLQRLVKQHFPSDRTSQILDLGCGHGALLYFARQLGFTNIRGVDVSGEQVLAAEKLGIPHVTQMSLFEALEVTPSESVDAVVTFDLIEHFDRDEVIRLVDEVVRVLKSDGRWILHTINGESPFAARMLFWDFTHQWAYTRTSMSQLMLASGFADVSCHEDYPAVHGVKSLVRWILWHAIRTILRAYLIVETGAVDRAVILSQNFTTVCTKAVAE